MANGNTRTEAIVKAAVNANRAEMIKTVKTGSFSIIGLTIAVLWLATSVNGYIAVSSNLNNKCNDNTVGVKIATNRTTRLFMIAMIVMSLLMVILSLMRVYHFAR